MRKPNSRVILLVLLSLSLSLSLFFLVSRSPKSPLSGSIRQRNLSKYQFSNLARLNFAGSQIIIENTLTPGVGFTSYLFSFVNDEGKKITGQLNIPRLKSQQNTSFLPVILLLRGYVDREIYTTGTGTKNAAAYLAGNGFITLAPDFRGYGGSDPEPSDILESRFEKPLSILSLFASLKNFPQISLPDQSRKVSLVNSKIGIWAHSNGGQIALSVLEITQKAIPTVLWAPVSLGFPESILAYADELSDHGEYIKNDLENFISRYDIKEYSIDSAWHQIQAPIQLHQGGQDDSVPRIWSDNLNTILADLNLHPVYFYYPLSDHNLRPDWNTAMSRTLNFFISKPLLPLSEL